MIRLSPRRMARPVTRQLCSALTGPVERAGLRPLNAAVGLTLAGLLAIAAPATAGPLQATAKFTGVARADESFGSLSAPAGDVNGDGLGDLIVGSSSGTWVVLGTRTPKNLSVPAAAPASFTVKGASIRSAAGDVDGDGYDDLLAVAGFSPGYVIYGGPQVRDVDIAGGDPRVTRLNGTIAWAGIGFSSAGDFDGDGKDDILMRRETDAVIILGRPRAAEFNATGTGPGLVKLTGTERCSYWYFIRKCYTETTEPRAIGDWNADGKDDIFLPEYGVLALGRTGTTAIPTRTPDARSIKFSNLAFAGINVIPNESNVLHGDSGDLTGDGITDLVFYRNRDTPDERIQIVAGRTTAGGGTIDLNTVPSITYRDTMRSVAAAGDQNGDGRQDLVITREDSVRILSAPASGTGTLTVGPPLAGLPVSDAGTPQSWTRNRTAAGIGDFDGDGLDDLVYGAAFLDEPGLTDRGAAFLVSRGTPDTTPDPEPAPYATLEWTFQEAATPAGVTPPFRVSRAAVLKGACPGDFTALTDYRLPGAGSVTSPVSIRGGSKPGDTCRITIDAPMAVPYEAPTPAAAEYPWRTLVSINGAPAVDITALGITSELLLRIPDFQLREGKNTVVVTEKWDPALATPIDDATISWTFGQPSSGPANTARLLPNGGGLELTPATTFQRGVAWDQTHRFDANHVKIDFDAVLDGTAGGGNGLVVGLAYAGGVGAPTNSTGAGLGWLGLTAPGNAHGFALSTFQGGRNPSANFVGIIAGGKTASGYPAWLQTADPGKTLAGATTHVTITAKDGDVTIAVDGVERLRRTMELVPEANLLITASTGNAVQRHVVKNLRVVTT